MASTLSNSPATTPPPFFRPSLGFLASPFRPIDREVWLSATVCCPNFRILAVNCFVPDFQTVSLGYLASPFCPFRRQVWLPATIWCSLLGFLAVHCFVPLISDRVAGISRKPISPISQPRFLLTEGKTDDTYQRKHKDAVPRAGKRNRGQTRLGCGARLSVVKQQTGDMWIVNKFMEEHNHGDRFRRSILIGCVERDLRNYERNLREEQRGHDADTLIEHFTLEKEKSPDFYFDYELDEDNKLLRCLWADAESKRSYGCFGYVVVFDTKYNTNRYSMIFAPFVGVNHHETPEEFEQRWNAAMETTDLHSNEWLCTMYDLRTRWVPVYVNHIFSVGMSSSQRAESGHSFFKKYVNRKNLLMGFITRFNRALTHQRHEELVCNHVDVNERPRITPMVMMEEQMVNIYTKKIFLMFQKEIEQNKCLMARHGLLAHKAAMLVNDASLTDARSSYLLGEFENLHLRVKEIDFNENNVNPHSSSKSRKQQGIQDPTEVQEKR
ncbi:Protein FAR1-RELATED SEQUENCE 1 [Abeliophyllum distichum]|uniref:Protein FAR1-RELATED SEQUENCE 1 n=1 Tax=Abeliophyllum distichum TaxID=126358 RepID=A0ABD1UMM2_9LAMI